MYLYPGIKCWCWIFWDFVSLSPGIVGFPDHNNNKKEIHLGRWAVSRLVPAWPKRGARFTVWLPRETAHDWPLGRQPSFMESRCSVVGSRGFADVSLDDTWCQPSMVSKNLCTGGSFRRLSHLTSLVRQKQVLVPRESFRPTLQHRVCCNATEPSDSN